MAKRIDVQKDVRAAAENAGKEAFAALAQKLEKISKTDVEPIDVVPDPEASSNRQILDAALVELLLSLDLPIRLPRGSPRSYNFWLYRWAKAEPSELEELRRVASHPFFGEALVSSFFPTRESKSEVGNWLARAARSPDVFARVFEALDAYGKTLSETWTVGALETHKTWIENVCQPAVLALCPSLARAIREMDPVRLLRNQLRAGVLDEWSWPAYEEALSRFPESDRANIAMHAGRGVLPHRTLFDAKTGRVIVVSADAIVFDREFPELKKMSDVRQAIYVGGDVLVCDYATNQARWLIAKTTSKWSPYVFVPDIECDGGVVTRSRVVVRPRDRKPPKPSANLERTQRVWFDGSKYYAPYSDSFDREGNARDGGVGCETFDPKTGETTGRGVPAWMAEAAGDAEIQATLLASFTVPAPRGAERSPLGAKDGFGGSVLVRRDGELVALGIDGRSAKGSVNGLFVVALMTFPAREGFYPVVQSAFDLGIAMPDGTTPLVPAGRLVAYFWGTPWLTHPNDWHALRPRDLDASKALAKCSDEQSKIIFDAVRLPKPEDRDGARAVSNESIDAVSRAIPEVKDARLALGIATIARAAGYVAPVVARLKTRAKPPGETSTLLNDHAAALARLFQHDRHWWIEKLGTQLGQQIVDVSHFFFDDAIDERVVTPAPTIVPWPLLLSRMGDVLYRVIAAGTPKVHRESLRRVLELWLRTGFPTHLPKLRTISLAMPGDTPELAGLDRDHPQRLVAWDNRYFFGVVGTEKDGRVSLTGIEHARGDAFVTPKNARLDAAEGADARFDDRAIRASLALFAERGAPAFDRSAMRELAKKTKLSVTAATLLFCAGYDPWLIGDKKQARFEIARDALDDAEKELKKLSFAKIYTRAMPEDPAQMYDVRVMIDRLANAMR